MKTISMEFEVYITELEKAKHEGRIETLKSLCMSLENGDAWDYNLKRYLTCEERASWWASDLSKRLPKREVTSS